jgi:hypothetical protein
MQYVALAVIVVVALAVLVSGLRAWARNASLRREMRARAITFRTELDWVKIPDPPWWAPWAPGEGRRGMVLVIRGDMFRVGLFLGLAPQYYFRAPETTIELSRNLLRISEAQTSREWIVVTGRQAGREFRLPMTTRHFLDRVWNALVAAGAVPTSGGPSPQSGRKGPEG